MLDISRKTYEINGIIIKNIEEGLDHKNWREIKIKYHSGQRKHGYELYNKSRTQ